MYVLNYRDAGKMRQYKLPSGDTIVGRARTSDIFINDGSVSPRQAKFSVRPDGCTVTDLSSDYGTYVNGHLVTRVQLVDGDSISGQAPFTIESLSDQLTLSDDHIIKAGANTIYRPVASLEERAQAAGDVVNVRFLRLVSDIARTLVTNKPPSEVFGQIVQLAFESLPAERAFLVLRDETAGTIVPRVARSRDGTDIGAVSLSRTVVSRVMSERLSILATDAQTDHRTADSSSVRVQGIRSFMCAPLWNEGDVIGVVYVDASQVDVFTSGDLDLFTVLANLAAVAIEQARLNAHVHKETLRRERLERYHSAGVVLRIFEAGAEVDAPFLAQERDVSVLFADMVGFTTLSETLTPARTALVAERVLRTDGRLHLRARGHARQVHRGCGHGGVWSARSTSLTMLPAQCGQRFSMQQALADLNAVPGNSAIRIRIGIHSGVVRVGDIGSVRRRE